MIKAKMAEMRVQVNLRMQAVGNQNPNQACIILSNTLRPAKPKVFNRNCDAKELKNFIFDMEQYFRAGGTISKETKVTVTSMHLSYDAKL